MATIKDVARQAGVAISTVSAVINRSAPVSEDVIARVEAAIAAIGYLPHGGAKALRSGDSRLVGVILPDITNPFFSMVARVVETVCMRAGYMTFVYNTDEDSEHEMKILRMMRMQRVAGMILISTRSDAAHGRRLLDAIHVPTVLFGSNVEGTPFDIITLDDAEASRLAIDHLVGLGHRRIAIVAGREGVSTHHDRLASALATLRGHGIEPEPDLILPADFMQDRAFELSRALLTRPDPPTAIFALSNLMLVGVMRALRTLGLACPRDVSLVGIGDFEWPEIMEPQMTVVATPASAMAEFAIGALLDEIAGKHRPSGRRTQFAPELIVRASCWPIISALPAADVAAR